VFLAIKQSHIIVHSWIDPVLIKEQIELDIYSCKDFNIKDVFKFLKKKGVYDVKYKLIDREKDLKNA
jgi:S-adenosylmethionine/arginine decarboxylase-like enzyme